jgi:hypothetical protein
LESCENGWAGAVSKAIVTYRRELDLESKLTSEAGMIQHRAIRDTEQSEQLTATHILFLLPFALYSLYQEKEMSKSPSASVRRQSSAPWTAFWRRGRKVDTGEGNNVYRNAAYGNRLISPLPHGIQRSIEQ